MPSHHSNPWPPTGFPSTTDSLIPHIKDYCLTHGLLLKLVRHETPHSVPAYPIGVSLYPTPFPANCFSQAHSLQPLINTLYARVACDEAWLSTTLAPLIADEDSLAATLWGIHSRVREEGYVQRASLGIFRADYMLHSPSPSPSGTSPALPVLKQVEVNTFSCAGGTHASNATQLHAHLQRAGLYPSSISSTNLRTTDNVSSLSAALAAAHACYGPPRSRLARRTCVLMVVQGSNVNIGDERPLEYALWAAQPPVPTYRAVFPGEVMARTALGGGGRELLYTPHSNADGYGSSGAEGARGETLEVSVVYMRAGYDEAEYDAAGIAARFHLERSAAIKCPSLLAHLATFKKVQQALGEAGELERFLGPEEANRIAEVCMDMWPMDGESERGREGRRLVLDERSARNFVLKPSLEGGGHNVYREEIPGFLRGVPEDTWGGYMLMRLIEPPHRENVLISPVGLHHGAVASELGVLGTCLWEQSDEGGRCIMEQNDVAGFTFKTKARHVNEMSVVKGYGCFDSPYLED